MRRLEIQDVETIAVATQQEILRSEESRYDHRLHGILLLCSGLSCYQVADMLGHSPRTVEYWAQRFERSGFSGLQEGLRSGRPPRLASSQRRALVRDLHRSPRDLGYPQNIWDGKLVSHHLAHKFGIRIGERQCQRLFHQLRFRRRKPRPVIAHADAEEQAAYKKTPPAGPQG